MKSKRNILVIAATSDIGTEICMKLGLQNTTLIITGRHTRKLKYLQKNVETRGGLCFIETLDLTNIEAIRSFKKKINHIGKKIDWIIYVAGHIKKTESVKKMTPQSVLKSFRVNVLSAIEITHAFSDTIKIGGGIIFISSTAGIWGSEQFPVYATTKGALNTFAQSLSKLWNTKKYAFSICPGPTNTKMRKMIAHDASSCQKPHVIADYIEKILQSPEKYAHHSVYVIRNNILTTVGQEPQTLS